MVKKTQHNFDIISTIIRQKLDNNLQKIDKNPTTIQRKFYKNSSKFRLDENRQENEQLKKINNNSIIIQQFDKKLTKT